MNRGKILLAIDPSSSVTGWAVYDDGVFHQSGLIKPPKKLTAWERTHAMIDALVLHLEMAGMAVIEVPSGKVNASHRGKDGKGGGGAGLTTYGMAVGAIAYHVETKLGREHVALVDQNAWTSAKGGAGSKAARRARAALINRAYDPSADPGMDESDSIALGHWHLQNLKLERLRKK